MPKVITKIISWQLSDRTKITFSGEYQVRPKKNGQLGLPAEGTVLPNPNGQIPRDRNIAKPYSTFSILTGEQHYATGADNESIDADLVKVHSDTSKETRSPF
ncbi:hypothetical protein [Nostoc sp.]|uniref:hypothetical protein n=1 Tax=Nostoc sp. TaxID=1180 RepID=UPI002FFCA5A1